MRSGLHVGIDLGTTNSAIAVFDGETVSVVPNAIGETLTPSVVRIDGRGGRTVGRRALPGLAGDPANTRGEFKRLMGTAERLRFEAAGAELLPEELSAAVLTSLLADARDVLGFLPRAAVISTPALFELPQSHATARAGKLAGLEEVVLIQEPVASAIAAGWRAEAARGREAGWCSTWAAARWTCRCWRRGRPAARRRPRRRQLPGRPRHRRRRHGVGAGRARAPRPQRRRARSVVAARVRQAARRVRAGQDRAVARRAHADRRCPSWPPAVAARSMSTSR